MLKDRLDWERIMAQPRNADGHTEVMDVLFKNAEVIAHCVESDYQGEQGDEGYVYRLRDTGQIVIVSDSFGSCPGCDAWVNCSDEEARRLCVALANNAHVFDSIEDAISFLVDATKPEHKGEYWDLQYVAPFLVEELMNHMAAEGG